LEVKQMHGEGKGSHTLSEIISQPAAWSGIIDLVEAKAENLLRLADGVQEVVFTGCGSALNVSLTLSPAFQYFTGIKSRAVPAAEIVFFPETVPYLVREKPPKRSEPVN
jgi:glucosamine--fructose-6-phosphate aminotransferase (isomerizing)